VATARRTSAAVASSSIVLIAFGLAGGALIGALAGFFAAVIALKAKRVRNDVLVGRSEPPIRDCVLPMVFVPISAVIGGAIAVCSRHSPIATSRCSPRSRRPGCSLR
jgi:hypothetical protein